MKAYGIVSGALVVALSVLQPGAHAKVLFSTSPATGANLLREGFLIGNGRLGAIPFGQPTMEKLSLNHDSLWSGGPFENDKYTGGNPTTEKASSLQKIRESIFQTGTGSAAGILGTSSNYGSFRAMANLSIVISDIKSYTNYKRSLDLSTGAHTTVFTAEDKRVYTSVAYCSYPARVCFYRLTVSNGTLPNVAVSLENQIAPSNLRVGTCGVSYVRLNGITQIGPPRGMEYDIIARLSSGPLGMPISSCSTTAPGTMVVTGSAYGPDEPLNTFSIVVGAQTDYDQTKCNAANKYSCKGDKPGPINEKLTASASTKLEPKMYVSHLKDYQDLMNAFNLTLHDPWAKSEYPSESLELYELLDRYRATSNVPMRKRSAESKSPPAEPKEDVSLDKEILLARAEPKEPSNTESQNEDQPKVEAWKPLKKRQYGPTIITSTTVFPGFAFPTNVPSGFNPNSQVPWSTAGTIYLTDYNQGRGQPPRTVTITLTRTPTAAIPMPNPYYTPQPTRSSTTWSTVPNAAPTPVAGGNDPAEVVDGGSYVESLLFDYARHLFICSSRQDSLPPNLQGVWTDGLSTAWSGDYHTNINLQMNHWFANQVGLGDLQQALWRFIKDTWVPRGTETAKLLYNAAGWVIHDEINIFGHTGMKGDATYANYPVAPAWIMQHVYDHYDYTRDLTFLQSTGYNLMRDVTTFWMSQLQQDKFTKDNTLVANPCNSPELGPTTFGCAHFQQLIYQLFETTLSAAWAVNDADTTFTTAVDVYMSALDKGLYIGSWGEIKEWKLPDSKGLEKQGDTHRHLSQLVGWFPGYSMSGFSNGYENATIQRAVETSLRSRGPGNGPDANAGWEKVWRAACWARLNNTQQADFELRYAIATNFAANGLSQYRGQNGPFQIDANFGLAGAMLSMLIVDLPAAYRDEGKRSVVLGPAIPKRWGAGKVSGIRVRGGTILDMAWNTDGNIEAVKITKRGEGTKFFSKKGRLLGEI